MPIYAYQCSDCGFTQDKLRKMSDPPLTLCPSCGKETLVKQVTAAGFQLKGSGWYVTDFRDSGAKPTTVAPDRANGGGDGDKPADKAASGEQGGKEKSASSDQGSSPDKSASLDKSSSSDKGSSSEKGSSSGKGGSAPAAHVDSAKTAAKPAAPSKPPASAA